MMKMTLTVYICKRGVRVYKGENDILLDKKV
jgi:hypothetical protein